MLAIEVGNSRWKAALFAAPPPADPAAVLRVPHGDDPAPRLRAFLAEHAAESLPARAFWTGVNPAGAAALLDAWPDDCGPPPIELPRAAVDRLIENGARAPGRVGVDRLLNALAAAALVPPALLNKNSPAFAVVADCGTATTVDTVRLNGGGRPEFLGGAILPGAVLCVKALHAHTALLPEIHLHEDAPADGRDTAAAIRFGVLEMQAAAVDRLLGGRDAPPAFQILTGGAADLITDRLRTAAPHRAPHLTLIGLALAAEER